jgi:hypothetical protein
VDANCCARGFERVRRKEITIGLAGVNAGVERRGVAPGREGRPAGGKPKFTEDDTMFLITCQVISRVVIIRMTYAQGVSC